MKKLAVLVLLGVMMSVILCGCSTETKVEKVETKVETVRTKDKKCSSEYLAELEYNSQKNEY